MLQISAGLLIDSNAYKVIAEEKEIQSGWLNEKQHQEMPVPRRDHVLFGDLNHLKGSGKDKQVCLWKAYEQVTGKEFEPHKQEIGSCVGEASTLGAEVLTTIQCLQDPTQEWRGKYSVEVNYVGSRVEVAGDVGPQDGSRGDWVTTWLREYGVVLRGRYGDIDLTHPRPDLMKKWANSRSGVPQELEDLAKDHPVKTSAKVSSWEEYCDAIANGYPILICSNQGFNNTCDSDGFLRPSGVWYHALLGWGVDSKSSRQGGCIANSWGTNWLQQKQHKLGTPPGCYWADAAIIDRMVKQNDSFALSGFKGFPAQNIIDYLLI